MLIRSDAAGVHFFPLRLFCAPEQRLFASAEKSRILLFVDLNCAYFCQSVKDT